ncbi:cytochrome c maturation protein CcmE [Loktanella sp. R86503]|uniref:cytochrome c maturation protein CcmE n=1 Tax=Loktanella TaxID=245186 RepID=UPI0036D87FC3
MKGLKKKRRVQVLALSGVCIAAVLGLLASLPDESFQFFRSPSEVAADPPRETELFRIGGLVEGGTIMRGTGTEVTFNVTDGGASIPVSYNGILPDLFAEGQGMVGQGRYINGTFQAVEILAKHDESYMPKEVVDALKDQGVYKAPDDTVATN